MQGANPCPILAIQRLVMVSDEDTSTTLPVSSLLTTSRNLIKDIKVSKLDTILTNNTVNRELKKIDLKILMLEIFGDALKEGDVTKMGEKFRSEVEKL